MADSRILGSHITHIDILMYQLAATLLSLHPYGKGLSDVVDRVSYVFFCDNLSILEMSIEKRVSETRGTAITFWDNSGDSKIDATVNTLRAAP